MRKALKEKLFDFSLFLDNCSDNCQTYFIYKIYYFYGFFSFPKYSYSFWQSSR